MTPHDYIRNLQAAARAVAEHCAHQPATRVMVLGNTDQLLINVAVPAAPDPKGTVREDRETAARGWLVTDRSATFDGALVPVAASRLRLLKTLAEATGPLTVSELTASAFDLQTDDANTRYHLRELKKELTKAFTFDEDVIKGDNDGYRLVLR